MGVVQKWLEGIGLPPPVVANFRAVGIVRPADLLELEVVHYEALGVADPADRRKLFFLVQRLKQAQQDDEEEGGEGTGTSSSSGSDGSNASPESERGSGSNGNISDSESSEGRADNYINDADGDMPPPPPPASSANDDEDAEAAPGGSKQPLPSSRRGARSRRTAATASATSVLESATAATITTAPPSASASASASSSGAGRTTRRSARAAAAVRDGASPRNRKKHGGSSIATTDGTAINSSPASSVENYDSPNRPVVVPRSKSNANAKSFTKSEIDNDGIGVGKGITKNKTTASRTRSRSPIRRTTRSASATTSTSTLEGPATATNARSRGRSKSPIRTTSFSRSTARSRSRSPVRMTNATKARAAAIRARSPTAPRTRSRSPVRATNSAGAGARSRSPPAAGRPRRPVTGTATSAAGARSMASRGTMAVGSPTKTLGTQTSSRRKKAPEVDLAEDIDTESDNDDDVPSRVMSKKGTKSPRRRPATANGGGAAASRSNSRRSLLSKQSSLPSLQSRSANLSDEGSVGSKSSAKSSSSAGSKSSRRRSTGTAKSSGNGSAGGTSSSRPASASGARGAGKRHSKLPGPSKIPSRVGSLSTIPSERAAIMSPLVKIQLDGGDAVNGSHGLRGGITYDDSDGDDDEDTARLRRRSGSLSSTGSSSGRRRLSAPLARAKSSSNLSSDEDQREGKRVGKRRCTSSIDSGRQSLGGLTKPRSRRTSSIGLPSKVGVTASSTSGRKASSPLRSQSPESQRADSVVSSEIDLSAELETGTSGFASGTVFVQGMPEDKSWGTQVSRLREEQNRAHEMEFGPEGPRRGDYDEDIDDMRIRVVVRKRPMSRSEAARKDDIDVIHPLEYHSYGKIMVYQPKTRVDLTKEVETIPFAFDNAFDESANNSEIYERTVSGLIPAVFDGQFCNVFAYGQTGSGKTFTMMGSNLTGANAGNQDDSNPGLYYLAAQDVFYLANEPEFQHLTVTASLFEIYSGKLFDLLNGHSPIKCLEDHRGKVCFPGLTEHAITNAGELMQLMENGAANRSTGTTSKNADSSRSHAVLQISLKSNRDRKKGIEHGRLTLIDLAGAERGADTSQASRATRLEGAEINTSLLALKEVIRALATGDSMKHIPFRGSKLTQVLKESFVGQNNRTVMVACVAPNMNNCEHTLNTLRYADRVKERDAQTGNIPAAVAEAASSVVNRKKKPTSTPTSILSPHRQVQRPATAPVGSNRSVDSGRSKDSFQEVLDAEDDDKEGSNLYDDHLLLDDDHDDHDAEDRRATSDSFILDRLLGDDTDEEHSTSAIPKPPTNRETAQSLIETHRTVMSEMLHMVKREMTLVNSADADRETMEEYLLELEAAQEKQLGLISNLREALVEYYASRTSS